MWLQQTDEPLFPDSLWRRPEQKAQAKRMLIIGGHKEGFHAAATAYQAALDAGIGEVKIILPASLRSIVREILPEAVFVTANPSGSFSKSAQNDILAASTWADVIYPVDLGSNSEAIMCMTDVIAQSSSYIVIDADLLHVLRHDLQLLLNHPTTLFVVDFAGLRHLFMGTRSEYSLRHDMGVRPLASALENLDLQQPLAAVYEGTICVVHKKSVTTTRRSAAIHIPALAAWCGTWLAQQPTQPLESLTTAAFEF